MADMRKTFSSEGRADKKLTAQAEKRKLSQKQYDTQKRKRVVQSAWLSEFEWAKFDDDDSELYCTVCRKYPKLSDPNCGLVTGLHHNFRKETLKFHAKSRKHIQCCEHDKMFDKPQTAQFAKSIQKVDEKTVKFMKSYSQQPTMLQ